MRGEISMLFAEFYFSLLPDGSIMFDDELTAEQLNIKPGDGFMAFVNPQTKAITLRKIDLTKVENISYGCETA